MIKPEDTSVTNIGPDGKLNSDKLQNIESHICDEWVDEDGIKRSTIITKKGIYIGGYKYDLEQLMKLGEWIKETVEYEGSKK